jgi:hypothetical protein
MLISMDQIQNAMKIGKITMSSVQKLVVYVKTSVYVKKLFGK